MHLLGLTIATALLTAITATSSWAANSLSPPVLLHNALDWVASLGYGGAIAFIALYIVATVAFLPGSVLTLGAGFVFGVLPGSLYVLIGATGGAIAAFLVGRYWVRDWVTQKIADNQRFRAIDTAVGREGLKIVLLTRLSPVFPFNVLNYAFGVTQVSLRDYTLGCLGLIPGTIMYVYIGSLSSNLALLGSEQASPNPAIQWTIRIMGLVATVVVTLMVTRIARAALTEEISSD